MPGSHACPGFIFISSCTCSAKAFCSYPMWTIPDVGTDSRCDHGECPKRVKEYCDNIYGVGLNETCEVYCADGVLEGNVSIELWKCVENHSDLHGNGIWQPIASSRKQCVPSRGGPSSPSNAPNLEARCAETWSSVSQWRSSCGPDPWKTFCPGRQVAKVKSLWQDCCFNSASDCAATTVTTTLADGSDSLAAELENDSSSKLYISTAAVVSTTAIADVSISSPIKFENNASSQPHISTAAVVRAQLLTLLLSQLFLQSPCLGC
eukprot:TRINITY_DN45772_c0_g1_i1.p1 TRINITY_DN45772_c0_g1~~TRINITY_DN45772_c0_g1_i1.p1  ORF type:complete len:264 (+),score=26.92 TRINITY_DN45772_c0_g1_i1:104-895(+)